MKKKLVPVLILGILVLISAGCNKKNITGDGSVNTGVNSIAVTQLKSELMGGLDNNTIVVDLREPILFDKGHIPGAVLIPFAEFEKKYAQLDKNKKIILVCHMGPMGEAAGQFLVEQGYKQVYNLDGGMRAWDGK